MQPRPTTTADPSSADAFLLRVEWRDERWYVGDTVTTRFGAGHTLLLALGDWLDDVLALTELDGPFGEALGREVEWARKVFSHGF